jgi:uncharacterized pyridoxamine 5'-phosphate oxidase family protein
MSFHARRVNMPTMLNGTARMYMVTDRLHKCFKDIKLNCA